MLLDDKIQIHKIINEVLIEVADGVYFHANDINSELYNYAWEAFNEKLEEKKKQEIENQKGTLSNYTNII